MSLKERVYSLLLVSASEPFNNAIAEFFPASKYSPLHTVSSVSEAKRCLSERSFDFILINAPLPDESGTRFAMDCCRSKSTVVLLIVKSELHDEIHDKVGEHGVFTLAKPISKSVLPQVLTWLSSARERLRDMEKKNLSVEEKMEEIRITNRAKFLLISELGMSEADAHRFIEKQAMDSCTTKLEVARNIIQTYSTYS